MEITGKVIQKQVSKGSKSEHQAVCMEFQGKTLILRQRGKNAFNNPDLQALTGKMIQASGDLVQNIFFLKSFKILPE